MRHAPNRPTVPSLKPFVLAWDKERASMDDDPLHCALEDGNFADHFFEIDRPDMPASQALADLLLQMSKTQRRKVAAMQYQWIAEARDVE